MEKITINEVLEAVAGKLVSGDSKGVVSGVSTDSRTIEKGDLFVALKGERFDGHEHVYEAERKGASAVLAGRRIKAGSPLILVKGSTLDALQKLAGYYRMKYKPVVIGVTGSNGKTTTKDMLASILSLKGKVTATKGNFNNLIGLPLTLFDIDSETRYCVLEMGMNHLGEIRTLTVLASPGIGVITNVGNAHMEHLGSISNVLKAKMELVDNLSGEGVAVINTDNPYLKDTLKFIKRKTITYGIKEKADVMASGVEFNPGDNSCSFTLNMNGGSQGITLSSFAENNIYNALAACSVAGYLGCEAGAISKALNAFSFPGMRFELSDRDGIKVINDSYNANPSSVEIALEEVRKAFGEHRKVAVLGDMLELGDKSKVFHVQAGRAVFKEKFKVLITIGSQSRYTAEAAIEAGMDKNNVFICPAIADALKELEHILRKNDVVLIKGSRKMGLDEVAKKIG